MSKITTSTYLLGMLIIPGIVNAQATNFNNIKNNKNKEMIMNTTQQNKDVVRKIFEESLNKRNLGLLKELISDDYVGFQGMKGAAGFQEPVLPLLKAFPDIQWNITELIAEGDKVVISWKWQGTEKAPYYENIPATGKAITNDGVAILTLANGKVTHNQVLTDRLGFLQAMTILPADINKVIGKKTQNGQVNFIDKFLVPEK